MTEFAHQNMLCTEIGRLRQENEWFVRCDGCARFICPSGCAHCKAILEGHKICDRTAGEIERDYAFTVLLKCRVIVRPGNVA